MVITDLLNFSAVLFHREHTPRIFVTDPRPEEGFVANEE